MAGIEGVTNPKFRCAFEMVARRSSAAPPAHDGPYSDPGCRQRGSGPKGLPITGGRPLTGHGVVKE